MRHGFSILPFRQLVEIVLNQLDNKGSFFNIPTEVFFVPESKDAFRIKQFGQLLETPFGTAAGPHTQMTQNIVASWLCGARYIELKTIQTLDELKVSKPCIDMQDEGYNCEWSQELKINESFDQYLNAWIIIHILQDKLGHPREQGMGTIFNMSIGYNLKGILQGNVQWFLNRMKDCSFEKVAKIKEIQDIYPRINEIKIPDRISDNVTLSTMHGCPPDEIEKIGKYLIKERKLNTIIKLNPTLLGMEKLNRILQNSGFDIVVPDEAFEHDLKYKDAVQIIKNLQHTAAENKVHLGIKLTNTLESINNKTCFPPVEKTMYMSGRALHPIAITLAAKLQNDFKCNLNISYSAGVNTFNLPKIISCGMAPVTVCTDLLKPGGYGLIHQYLDNLREQMFAKKSKSIDDYIQKIASHTITKESSLINLNHYASGVLLDKDYKQFRFSQPDIKSQRSLSKFDCIGAPCVDACPTNQDIPDYLHFTAKGNFTEAFETIFKTNPFPNTTGMICDHLCQTKCSRINYDDPLLIREIKRTIAENFNKNFLPFKQINKGHKVAVIGAGPSGLSCAFYLNLAGFQVDVFESKSVAGGMVTEAIPSFRLSGSGLKKDLERIEKSGVKILLNSKIDLQSFNKFREEYNFIYISTGAWSTRKFGIEGINTAGVLDPIKFLAEIKNGSHPELGQNIAVIGGGNTAIDTARAAFRLTGKKGKVTILYRRSKALMPADPDEIKAAAQEGITILDLMLPVRVNAHNERVRSLTCVKLKLADKPGAGRPIPVEIPNSEFELEFDTVIPAIGQDTNFDFIDYKLFQTDPTGYVANFQNVFIGGDAKRGGSTVINAIADGRKTARLIIEKTGIIFDNFKTIIRNREDYAQLMVKRMRRQKAVPIPETLLKDRKNFNLVTGTLPLELAKIEASRCLKCDELCNICVTVCPNLACYSYRIEPIKVNLQRITNTDEMEDIHGDNIYEIKQEFQILHIADWCNECGNCSTFCPTSDAPYKVKPHLFLNKSYFAACDEGFFYDPINGRLSYKKQNIFSSLTKTNDQYNFTNDKCVVSLAPKSFKIIDFKNNEIEPVNLKLAIEMSLILTGAKEFWNGTIKYV
jgi:putative selenate reductase